MPLKALEIPKPLHMASNFSRASVLIGGRGLRRSCVAQGMRLVAQVSESMAGPIADLSRTYHSGTISHDHAGRFSHFNASCGVTSRCGTDGAVQIFKRNEDHKRNSEEQ